MNRYHTRNIGRYTDVLDETTGLPVIDPSTGVPERIEGLR